MQPGILAKQLLGLEQCSYAGNHGKVSREGSRLDFCVDQTAKSMIGRSRQHKVKDLQPQTTSWGPTDCWCDQIHGSQKWGWEDVASQGNSTWSLGRFAIQPYKVWLRDGVFPAAWLA